MNWQNAQRLSALWKSLCLRHRKTGLSKSGASLIFVCVLGATHKVKSWGFCLSQTKRAGHQETTCRACWGWLGVDRLAAPWPWAWKLWRAWAWLCSSFCMDGQQGTCEIQSCLSSVRSGDLPQIIFAPVLPTYFRSWEWGCSTELCISPPVSLTCYFSITEDCWIMWLLAADSTPPPLYLSYEDDDE